MKYTIPSCKKFTGYKPCFPGHDCFEKDCRDFVPMGVKILLINLDAMGDVLMTTAQLQSIKRKFPESTIFWITLKNAASLLDNNPLIDRVFSYDFESVSILMAMEFDYVMNVDKSMRSGALAVSIPAKNRLGFGINSDGKIIPLNKGAEYNYCLGLDDHLKFRVNKRTRQEYLAETFEVDCNRNEYIFNFSDEELTFIKRYREEAGISKDDPVIGLNTGCSNLYPNKKMTIEQHIALIDRFLDYGRYKIVLLGGKEDEDRNTEIYSRFKGKIVNTPTSLGVRKGACFESLADVVITGDSFGMHLAIALKKYVIAWFGISCWEEIDLYNRGVKLYHEDLLCSPCWKRECPYNLECITKMDIDRFVAETVKYFSK